MHELSDMRVDDVHSISLNEEAMLKAEDYDEENGPPDIV